MKYNNDHDIWVEKYRPQTIEDCILPNRYKEIFQGILKKGQLPHLLLSGEKGIGKTSAGLALCHEMNMDVLFINASKDRGVEVLRTDIVTFASGKSLTGKKKIVFLDESDHMTKLTQDALRGVMEDKKILANCRFILTCNHPSKIIPEIHSRCSAIEFQYTKEEHLDVAKMFFGRIKQILEIEQVTYDTSIVVEIIKKFLPDFRRVLNELQLLSVTGNIPQNALETLGYGYIEELAEMMVKSEFTKLSEWTFSNTQIQFNDMMLPLFNLLKNKYITPVSVPTLVLLMRDTSRNTTISQVQSIELLGLFVDIMTDCEFK